MTTFLSRALFLIGTFAATLYLAPAGYADDWRQFLGPERTGVVSADGLLRDWPEEGPPVLWRHHLGEGFSGILAVEGRLFTLFADGDKEYAAAFHAVDGEEIWRVEIGKKFIDVWGNGPRSTPIVDGDTVYVVSSNGQVLALRVTDGEVIWTVDMNRRFGPSNRPLPDPPDLPTGDVALGPYWGHCSSPLVEGDLLIVHPGAEGGRSLAALDKRTGATVWSILDNPLSYSSPIVVTIGGKRQVVMAMANEIVGVGLDGEVLWRLPWALFTIAQPVFVAPDRLFVSSPNEIGGLLFAITQDAAGWTVEEVWRNPTMRNTWSSTIAVGDLLVGFDNATLKVLDGGGELAWAKRGMGKGTVLVADDLLIVLSDRGTLTLAEWSPEGFRQLGRMKVLEGPTWTAPTLARGRLYLRDHLEMVAIDLTASGPGGLVEAESEAPGVRPRGAHIEPKAEMAILRSAEALGGDDAWRNVDSMVMTGNYTSFSFVQPFRMSRKRPNLYRFDHSEGMFPLTTAWDGTKAWWLTSVPLISKASWPVVPPSPYWPILELDAELDPPFVRHREKGHQIAYLGETVFEGGRFMGFDVVRGQTGQRERWFVDRETWLPVLRISQGVYHGYHSEQVTQFRDYRRVAGVMIPFRIEIELGNDFLVIQGEDVEINVPLDDALFQRPVPKGMESLQSLAGRWRVEIENLDNPSFNPEVIVAPRWEVDTTSSVITSRFGGSLLEEEVPVTTARPRTLRRSFTYDRFRDVFRVAYFDTFSRQLDVLEGTFDDAGRLVLSNLRTDTGYKIYQQTYHVREVLYDITEDNFRLDREVSLDGGQTWRTDLRFHYVRAADTASGAK